MTHALRRLALVGLVCGSIPLASCIIVKEAPPSHPHRQPAAAPPQQPQMGGPLGPHGANGRPANLRPGAPAAFWIWRGNNGMWHLRTTTAGRRHMFTGHIKGSGGANLTNVQSARVETGDKIRLENGDIRFELLTDGHEDGLDFAVAGGGCARFNLKMDDDPRPDRIRVGQFEQRPPAGHFELCP